MTRILNLTNSPHHPTFVLLFWSTCINMRAIYYTDYVVLKIGYDQLGIEIVIDSSNLLNRLYCETDAT
jgi:hypothetical protein